MATRIGHVLHGDALAVAASCDDLLHGNGPVAISTRLSKQDGDALPWLEIVIPKELPIVENDRVISAVRAGVDALRALAQCAGFAPQLNTHAWQEILFRAGVTIHSAANVVEVDAAFPRVRLCFEPIEGTDRAARHEEAQRVAWALDAFIKPVSIELQQGVPWEEVRTRLESFRSRKANKNDLPPLPLSLSLPSMDTQDLLPVVAAFVRQWTFSSDATAAERMLVEISLNQQRFRPADPLVALQWLDALAGIATISQWTLDEAIDDPHVLTRLYRRLLGLDDSERGTSGPLIHTLHVVAPAVADRQHAALCSALPLTRTVHCVRFDDDPDWDWGILGESSDWAWLGYAVFHEHTAIASTWRALAIHGASFGDEPLESFGAVQRDGVAALCGLFSTRDRIQTGNNIMGIVRARQGTRVWHVDDLMTTHRPLLVLPERTTLDSVGMLTVSTGTFQACIVPGVGVGYIMAEDLITDDLVSTTCSSVHQTAFETSDVRDAPLRASCLVSLTASQDQAASSAADGLMSFVRVCGSALRSLTVATNVPLAAHDVHEILSACPALASIALDHEGSYWANWEAERSLSEVYPHLTSIHLTCSMIGALYTVTALSNTTKEAFPAVQKLRFDVTKGCSVFPTIAKTFGLILDDNTTIESLSLVKIRDDSARRSLGVRRTPSERRDRCLARLGLAPAYLELPSRQSNRRYEEGVRIAMQPLPGTLSMPVPTEVMSKVLGFVGGIQKRHVWLDLV